MGTLLARDAPCRFLDDIHSSATAIPRNPGVKIAKPATADADIQMYLQHFERACAEVPDLTELN
jgi:hypothetical protein